jgi:2',3'-cyclic-nucleotide 2'-phosphodiesterase
MRIVFFGDIVGSLGLMAVSDILPFVRKTFRPDFVIANGENATKGKGLSYKDYKHLIDMGVDCVTLGNHWHSRDQIENYIGEADLLVRPINLKNFHKGVGSAVFQTEKGDIRVTNILGQAFLDEEVKEPYQVMSDLLDEAKERFHFVDFHAESTSEKQTFAYGFDGEISVVVGTHTHVQTNDAHVLPSGTGYISDAGMCGGFDTVIGASKESAIDRFLFKKENARLAFPEDGSKQVNFVLIDLDDETGMCVNIVPYFFVDGKEKRYGKN